ncbi:sugar ABC transporter ATP-binding protein [Microbacterium allomyrinae]|uniref:Sugar ABC transporter ATP-binding protein n=1 Tax=Microbacterium allomyrinae TaxID=2830666 RepID=A0A9X1LTT8_9MICO|nr:sugar ABC transporter ATP-binding protein [Microbacterium allomyrinae]MCC2031553.1 sugar ABC transporter ATP-binding protein [Microbacterium allomyrinae]
MREISKSFGPATVLDRVSLELAPGEIHGLVGQNGAGKSTLMKVLGGVYPDHGGTIEIDDESIVMSTPRAALAAGIAVIYQELSLIPSMTVAENIVLGIEPGRVGYDRSRSEDLAREVISRSSALSALPLNRLVGSLGAGTQQMVEIAKALARNAKVLVLDEPTARLSGPERDQLHALTRELASHGTSVVYISHFLEDVLDVTSRLTVLRNGAVVTTADTATFTRDSLVRALLSRALLEDEFSARDVPPRASAIALRAESISAPGFTDIDIDLREGEIFAIAGLVGSGRTRLARALSGAARIRQGRLEVGGRRAAFRSPRAAAAAGVVLVPEDRKSDGIIASATAQENLLLRALDSSLAPGGIVRIGAARRIAQERIEELQVHPPLPQLLGSGFSGGNQQKLLIGRALLARPKVLITDQPTAGVDVGAKAQIHALIRDAAAAGTAVIVISDDLDELLALAHTVAIVDHGRITSVLRRDQIDHDQLVERISAA